MIERLEKRELFSTYYFSSLAGNDAAPVNSADTPWASLTKLNSIPLQAGDVVLLKANETFNGTLLLDSADVGSSGNPIIITGDGGKATIESPAGHGIFALNTAGVQISNLNIVGSRKSANTAIDSDPNTLGSKQSPGSFSGIAFDNNQPGDTKLSFVHIDNVDVSGFGNYGVTVGGSAGKSGFNDVSITNVTAHDNTLGGIETHGVFTSTGTAYANTDVYVAQSVAYNNPGYAGSSNHVGDGIMLSDVDGATIERCESYNNGALNTHVGGPVGIWFWDVNDGLIQNNESHHNHTGSSVDGGGFDLDGGVTNTIVQYNYSHDNDGAGYGIFQFQGARPFHDNVVRYNITANDSRKNSSGVIDFWNGNGSNGIFRTDVYNNTAYVTPSTKTTTVTTTKGNKTTTTTSTVKVGDPRALRFLSGTTDVTIRNNIFYVTGDVPLAQIDAKQTNLQIQGNDWYSSGTFNLKAFAKVYTSFSAFVSGTGYEKLNGVTVGKNVDPGFNSVNVITVGNTGPLESAVTSFKLNSNALRGNGLNLRALFQEDTGNRDFYNNALPTDTTSKFDIGANQTAQIA